MVLLGIITIVGVVITGIGVVGIVITGIVAYNCYNWNRNSELV
jgi:hypothetical protein